MTEQRRLWPNLGPGRLSSILSVEMEAILTSDIFPVPLSLTTLWTIWAGEVSVSCPWYEVNLSTAFNWDS